MLAALIGVQHGADTHVLDRATSGPKPGLVKQLGAIAGHAAGPGFTLGWVMTWPQRAATLAAG